MRKVIVKCRIKNRDHFKKRIEDIGLEFSSIYWQHDRVYVPRGYKGRSNYPRLIMRTEMHGVDDTPAYLLSLRRHIEDSGVDIIEDCPVTDYQSMVNVILQLGFKEFGDVSRRRQEIKMSENTMLYLDILDDANTVYAKIESVLEDKEPAAQAKLELINTMRSFGETNVIESTYFEL